jgi:hypothetical protein
MISHHGMNAMSVRAAMNTPRGVLDLLSLVEPRFALRA